MNLSFPWFHPKPVAPPPPGRSEKKKSAPTGALRATQVAGTSAQPASAPIPAAVTRPASAADQAPAAPETLTDIFLRTHRELRPRTPLPPIFATFYPFTGINNTIRMRGGALYVRISDALAGAPPPVLEAIAHVLVAKLYRKPVHEHHAARFREYVGSEEVSRHAERIRQQRGSKRLSGHRGRVWDLQEVFDSLNERFFSGAMARPTLTWSEHHARRLLGHYDAAHNTIVVSRVFDRPGTPRYAVEYLLYHEMLHLRHPVTQRGARRCVHPPAFQADERLFPDFARAKQYLKTL